MIGQIIADDVYIYIYIYMMLAYQHTFVFRLFCQKKMGNFTLKALMTFAIVYYTVHDIRTVSLSIPAYTS